MSPNYTPEQAAQLRAAFAPTLATYRRRMKWFKWGAIGFAGLLLVSCGANQLGLPFPEVGSLVGLLCACLPVLAFVLLYTQYLLKCSGCTQNLEKVGTYCPECSSPGLRPATTRWLKTTPAHCDTCGKDIAFGDKGARAFRIRACSHCGLYLDDEGV